AAAETVGKCASVHCGWGRVLFGQTFASAERLAKDLMAERTGQRDLAIYVRDPHVILSMAPQALFMDPSHSFRLDLTGWREPDGSGAARPFDVRPARPDEEAEINRIYATRGMVPLEEGSLARMDSRRDVLVLVAESQGERDVLGVVMGIDHAAAF